MTITARKYALLSGISPRAGQMAGLFAMELAVLLSWTVLLDTILRLLSGSWMALLPVSYFFAVTLLAWLESPGRRRRENNPLEALGLAEVSLDGKKPDEWQTLRRLAATPPLLILLCIGLAPVPGTGKNLLQLISGTKIIPLDETMDPRPDDEIFRSRKKALMKVIAYTMVSFMMAAVITFVPPELSRSELEGRITAVHSLPERERQLLADYLEMKAMYPDCLEYHVRLASLYYRNDMKEDLQIELAYIRRRDPNHAILLLEQDLSVNINNLLIEPDTVFADSVDFTGIQPDAPAEPDSAAPDSQIAQPETTIQELTPITPDSFQSPPDTAGSLPVSIITDTSSAVVPEESDSSMTAPLEEQTAPPGSLSTEGMESGSPEIPLEDTGGMEDSLPVVPVSPSEGEIQPQPEGP
ncbi:MAG: hypothetical protein JXA64_11265 [Candidatus Fermentibacteraceae bacterium]|nr:hypothetical protein [Candidatus Fermentibacteraceae bacterium]MBN2609684.1 hypothetical protein [Candidatus Fermentibacteraceae bacterium]